MQNALILAIVICGLFRRNASVGHPFLRRILHKKTTAPSTPPTLPRTPTLALSTVPSARSDRTSGLKSLVLVESLPRHDL